MTKKKRGQNSGITPADVVSAPAERILHWLQKIINHDLPNQMVAVRGWVNLLQTEEMEHLTHSGSVYLQRLIGSVEKAQDTIQLMSETACLCTDPHRIEPITIASLVPIMQRMVEERANAIKIDWDLSVEQHMIRADGPLLAKALAEITLLIVKHPATNGNRQNLAVGIGCKQKAGGVDLWIEAKNEILEKAIEKRLEYLFANETAELCGGTFQIQSAQDGADRFLFHFPGYTATV